MELADEAALTKLAHDVAATLTRVGLPTSLPDWVSEESQPGGATVWIDPIADSAGGVYVAWSHHPELAAVVRRAVETMDLSGDDVRFAAATLEAMRQALQSILSAAGFLVTDAPDISGAQALVRLPPG